MINKLIFLFIFTLSFCYSTLFGQWTLSSDGIFSEKINSIYSDGAGLYACTGNFGLFYSNNNGVSWSLISSGVQDKNINSAVKSGASLIIGANSFGIYTSSNNGLNWSNTNNGLTNLSVKCLASIGTYVVAGTDGDGAFISTNSGISWTGINNGLSNPEVRCFFADGNILYAGTANGISISTNNGAQWNVMNSGLPAFTTITSISKKGTELFASTYNGIGVFKSTNSGLNWYQCNNGLPSNFHINHINVIDGTLFAATGDGVYSSSNSGVSWNKSNNGIYYPEATYIFQNGSDIFAGTLMGLFKSNNNGASWTASNTGFLNNLIIPALFNIGNDLYAGTRGNGVFKSTNSGISWFPVNNGIEGFDIEAFALKGNKLFAATDNGIYRTTDFGITWTQVYDRKLFYSMTVKDSCVFAGICSCSGGGILKSTDDGLHWNYVNNGLMNNNVLALANAGNKIYCGTNDGLYVTTNLGVLWDNVKSGLPQFEGITCLAVNGNNLLAGMFEQGVYLSTNNGDYWDPINEGLPSALRINSVCFSGSNYIISTPLGVYVRNANSGIWTAANSGFQTPDINSVTVIGNTAFAGSGLMMGSGVWKRPLSQLLTHVSNTTTEIPGKSRLHNIYPNPYNPLVEINFDICQQGIVRLTVYDIMGREISTLVNEYKTAGSYTSVFNGTNFSSGIYFVRLVTSDYAEAKKLMLIK